MKKFIYVAIMAVAVVFASCQKDGYKKGDPAPDIDITAGTINGVAYDNETSYCWHTVVKTKDPIFHISATIEYFDWGTEFSIKSTYEMTAWTTAQMDMPYKYESSKATEYSDYEACKAADDALGRSSN